MATDKLQQIFARCWKEPDFKKRFLANPRAVLEENNFDLPKDVQVKVVENVPGTIHIVLPANPDMAKLSDEELDKVAGGLSISSVNFRVIARGFQLHTKTQGKECVPW